jgi:hypothetical protein
MMLPMMNEPQGKRLNALLAGVELGKLLHQRRVGKSGHFSTEKPQILEWVNRRTTKETINL